MSFEIAEVCHQVAAGLGNIEISGTFCQFCSQRLARTIGIIWTHSTKDTRSYLEPGSDVCAECVTDSKMLTVFTGTCHGGGGDDDD